MKPTTLTKLLAVAFLAFGAAWAEEEEPGRGVARLSLISGDVSVRRGDSGDWIAGAVNTPLVVQDHVVTRVGSRAEIQFDWANMLRLAPNTEVRLSELEYRRYQVQMALGTATLAVLRDSDAEIEVNTPQVSVRPVKRGLYRITVREDGTTEVSVRSGEVEVFSPRGVERLNSGRTMLVRGTASEPEFQTVRALAEDDWDRWNENRNRQLERSGSYRYVSRHIYGADDLDYYGRWVWDVPYGWVWIPSGIGPYWAPYRYGRWTWVDWYGWTWLSYDPWGWAPFHYGRWYNHHRWGWCWWPGSIHHRHYWRPGLVAFFGWGRPGGFHVGIGFGHVGWVPLAPYEPFYPWYGHRYYSGYRNRVHIDNSVNIVNNTNITNVYRNARVTNAVSGMEAGEFVRGRTGRVIQASQGDVRRASLVRGAVPVAPTRESLRFSDRVVQAPNLHRTSEQARFYSRRQVAAVERVPFEQQRQGVERMVRGTPGGGAAPGAGTGGAGNLPRKATERPTVRAESGAPARAGTGNLPRGATERPTVRAESGAPARAGTGNLPRGESERSESGWRRVGEPARVESRQEPQQEGTRTWRRFGEPAQRGSTSEGQPRLERRTAEPIPRGGASQEGGQRFGSPAGRSEQSQPPAQERGTVRRESDQGSSRFGTLRRPAESGSSPRMSAPRSEPQRSEPSRSSAPRSERIERSQPVRINPPIVRERSTPRPQNLGGMSRQSAPSGRTGGAQVRSGGQSRSSGSTSRGSSGGSVSRSGGGRGRSR